MIIKRPQPPASGGGNKTFLVDTLPQPGDAINSTIAVGDLVVVTGAFANSTYAKVDTANANDTALRLLSNSNTDYQIENAKALPVSLADGRYEATIDHAPQGGLINDMAMVLLTDGTTIEVTGLDVDLQAVDGEVTIKVKLPASDTAELTSLGIASISVSYLRNVI